MMFKKVLRSGFGLKEAGHGSISAIRPTNMAAIDERLGIALIFIGIGN